MLLLQKGRINDSMIIVGMSFRMFDISKKDNVYVRSRKQINFLEELNKMEALKENCLI